jgi:hypothetical protein
LLGRGLELDAAVGLENFLEVNTLGGELCFVLEGDGTLVIFGTFELDVDTLGGLEFVFK